MKTTLTHIFIILLSILFILPTYQGVMQITLNNLKNVLSTYEQLHILFHNPQCIHSRKYVQQFLKTDTQHKLGVVDCLRQLNLCSKYNLTYYPVLARINLNNQTQIIDEQNYLVQHQLKDKSSDQALVNRFVKYLQQQDESSYAIVVFQYFGLPVQKGQKHLEQSQQIFYLQPYHAQNQSNFTKLLSSFVNNQQGCWIIKKLDNNNFEKYYCQSGYNKTITKKFIQLFKQGMLKKFIFSQQKVDQSVYFENAITLHETIQNYQKYQEDTSCKIIYVHSSHCLSCSTRDFNNLKKALQLLNLSEYIQITRFNIDTNQIPEKLIKIGLRRVPELIYICKSNLKIFQKVLFINNIKQFVQKEYFKSSMETIIQSQNKQKNNKEEGRYVSQENEKTKEF